MLKLNWECLELVRLNSFADSSSMNSYYESSILRIKREFDGNIELPQAKSKKTEKMLSETY